MISINADATITSWNPAAQRLYGYKAPDMLGQSFTALVPPELRAPGARVRKRVLTGKTMPGGHRHHSKERRADGSDVTVLLSLSPILLDGQVIGVLRIARDGTHREQSERAARRLAAIVESSDDAIVSKDLNGMVTSWNRASERCSAIPRRR